MAVLYIMDTSEWINLFRRYPETVFPSLWLRIENLISDTRIVSPKVVLDEIQQGNDELAEWCKDHRKMFHDDPWVYKQVMNITNKHPTLIKPGTKPDDADPYIIALAIFYKQNLLTNYTPIIVTDENVSRVSGIPYVARDYDIDTCKLLELFKKENWKF